MLVDTLDPYIISESFHRLYDKVYKFWTCGVKKPDMNIFEIKSCKSSTTDLHFMTVGGKSLL